MLELLTDAQAFAPAPLTLSRFTRGAVASAVTEAVESIDGSAA